MECNGAAGSSSFSFLKTAPNGPHFTFAPGSGSMAGVLIFGAANDTSTCGGTMTTKTKKSVCQGRVGSS